MPSTRSNGFPESCIANGPYCTIRHWFPTTFIAPTMDFSFAPHLYVPLLFTKEVAFYRYGPTTTRPLTQKVQRWTHCYTLMGQSLTPGLEVLLSRLHLKLKFTFMIKHPYSLQLCMIFGFASLNFSPPVTRWVRILTQRSLGLFLWLKSPSGMVGKDSYSE